MPFATSRRAAVVLAALAPIVGGLVACTSSGTGSGADGGTAGKAGAAADPHVANVTITAAKGCELNTTKFSAGGITFKIDNKDATAVSEVELLSGERILGEKENIAAGLAAEFAVNVGAGTYTLYCPGATTEKTRIDVTGKAVAVDDSVAALVKQGTAAYKSYVDNQIGYFVTATEKLNRALSGTDLKAAQAAYIAARPFYEKIEPVAESFVNGTQNLDADIDARANDVPASQWRGYHRIEKALFEDKTLSGTAKWGRLLIADVLTLQQKAKSLTYKAPDLANGAQGLLDEIASTKITGEEERYSHIDVVDMANNVEGSEQAFADLKPALMKIDATLASTISTEFVALDKVVDAYRTQDNASGYVLYTTLTDADRRTLSAAVKAVAEPMSRVAGKVADA